jgi:cystathionine gamma-lyase
MSVLTWAGGPSEVGYTYGRDGNPTWDALETSLGELEDAQALAFASGQAASLALLLVLGEEGRRIVVADDGYYNLRKLAARLGAIGLRSVAVDLQDLGAVEAALADRPSALWAETPTNPLLRVLDLERLSGLAAAAEAPMIVDNTTATAALQRPLDWGATASVVSLTKSTSGHSDLLLGAVTARDETLLAQVRSWRSLGGCIAGPFEAWLAHRGLSTLPLRIERQSATALAIARHLAAHERVVRVHYPGLEPSTLAIAERQMIGGFGPLLSFEVDGDAEAADRVVSAARLIRPATSFGGVESSWERRARWPSETAPPALIRLSAGLEDPGELLADVDAALAAA